MITTYRQALERRYVFGGNSGTGEDAELGEEMGVVDCLDDSSPSGGRGGDG